MNRLNWLRWISLTAAVATLVPLAGCGDSLDSGGTELSGGVVRLSDPERRATPPELAPGGTWINSQNSLTLADLRGSVVWLEFSFLH